MNTREQIYHDNPILAKRWERICDAAWRFQALSSVVHSGHSERKRALAALRKVLPSLLSSSTKTEKSEKTSGVLVGVIYLSPATESGYNVCPFSSSTCRRVCLGHDSGRMAMDSSKHARILRTWFYFTYRDLFQEILEIETRNLVRRAYKKGLRPFIRPNGTSDLNWTWLAEKFPAVQFYDYTKSVTRMADFLAGKLPSNYHLTFSRSEENETQCLQVLQDGGNVAAVFEPIPENGILPMEYLGIRIADGDLSDARPDDSRGVWIGLKPKGPKARKDTSGFVVRRSSPGMIQEAW
jgi:hypothetical protein